MTITELTPKSEPAQRFEVFTGAGRRRIWTAEEKARILSETEVPGASVSAVARRHGLTPQQVFTWRRQARQAGETSGEDPMMFAVVVAADAADAADGIAANTPVIEIAIGEARVLVPPDIDPVRLTAVLRAVRKALQ